jgi:hypothetical protein
VDAATFIREAAEEIDQGVQPERGTTYGLGTAKNVSIVLIAGASCGALPIVGGILGGSAIGTLEALPP